MNSGNESIADIINQAQYILHKWKTNLEITEDQLKLDKYYQTLILYQQKNNKAILIPTQHYNLTITLNDREENIPYISLYETRVLVRVLTNLSNNNSSIIVKF